MGNSLWLTLFSLMQTHIGWKRLTGPHRRSRHQAAEGPCKESQTMAGLPGPGKTRALVHC